MAFALSKLSLCLTLLSVEAFGQILHLPFTRELRQDSISKRDTGSATLENPMSIAFLVNISIGDPPQYIQAQIDSGSSDLWVFGPDTCTKQASTEGCVGGEYNPRKSSSSELVEENGFYIKYGGPNAFVHGDIYTDDLEIAGLAVKNQQFNVAYNVSHEAQGVFGVGFESNEAGFSRGDSTKYSNFLSSLVSQDLINSRAYSIYMDGPDQNTGGVIFGGYDTEKYEGAGLQLAVQPNSDGQYTELAVVCSFLGYNDGEGIYSLTTEDFQGTALLDSGTTFMDLTDNLYYALLEVLGFENTSDGWFIECDTLWNSHNFISFGFGGITDTFINVPFRYFARNITNNGQPAHTEEGDLICMPAFKGGSSEIVLGDTFMRAAYTVFNLDHKYIWLAQAKSNSKSNIIALDGNSSGLSASATGTASAAFTATGLPGNDPVWQTASRVPTDLSFTKPAYNPTGTKVSAASKSDDKPFSTSNDAATTAGVGVAEAIFGAALVGFIIL